MSVCEVRWIRYIRPARNCHAVGLTSFPWRHRRSSGREGGTGVRLRASAPSIHLMRANIKAEVNPIVGTEKQSEELVHYLLSEFEEQPEKIWDTNIFGKSLNELVREELSHKLSRMPDDARGKIRETLEKTLTKAQAV